MAWGGGGGIVNSIKQFGKVLNGVPTNKITRYRLRNIDKI